MPKDQLGGAMEYGKIRGRAPRSTKVVLSFC